MNDLPVQTPLYDVVTEIEGIDDDRKNRIISMIYGNLSIDHDGRYADRNGDTHQLSKIHFTHEVFDDVPGADTKIAGVDDLKFEAPLQIYLEDDQGAKTGMNHASGVVKSEWRMGIVLKDESGQGWFCGYDNIPADHTTTASDAPLLQKISLDVPVMVERSYGQISETLPMEGEFHISTDDKAMVTSIPWMSTYADTARDDQATPEQMKYREQELKVVKEILERIAGLEADCSMGAGL